MDIKEELDVVEINGIKGLYTEERLNGQEIEALGLHLYAIRHDDDGNGFAALEPKVLVNFAASFITKEEVNFPAEGYIALDDESVNFTGDFENIEEFSKENKMKTNDRQKTKICPICGREYIGYPALSRTDNKTLICPDCGTRQALESIGVDLAEQERVLDVIHQYTRN